MTQCCSPPSTIPWVGRNRGHCRGITPKLQPPAEARSPPWRIVVALELPGSRGHFWQVTHLTYFRAGTKGRTHPGVPIPSLGSEGSPDASLGWRHLHGGGGGVCVWPDKSCPSFAAWLQPQVTQLVQERPSSHRGWDAEPPETQGRVGLGSRTTQASSPCEERSLCKGRSPCEGCSPPTQGMCQPL